MNADQQNPNASELDAILHWDSSTSHTPPDNCVTPWSATCDEDGSLVTQVLSYEETRALIVRQWLLCSAVSVAHTSDEAGIVFHDDGTYAKLYVDDQGNLVEGKGFEGQGTWELMQNDPFNSPGSYQFNITHGTGGTNIAFPKFTKEPLKMLLVTMANSSIYLALDNYSGSLLCP